MFLVRNLQTLIVKSRLITLLIASFLIKIYVFFIRNNEKVQDEPNECVEYNKKKKKNNIIELNSLCKTLDEDKEIYHGDNVLDSSSSTDKYL
jgi:hypothetical protein